jgi:putative serine protease PepD
MHEQDLRWSRETAQQAAPTTSGEQPTAPQPVTAPRPQPVTPPAPAPQPVAAPAPQPVAAPVPPGPFAPPAAPPSAPSYSAPSYSAPPYSAPSYSAPPYSGAPYSGAPFTGAPVTGAPYPPFPPPPYQPVGQQRSGRAGRVVLVLLAALTLSLASGAIGGLIVHSADNDSGGTTVINRQNAPQIDRSSVAGVAEAMLPSVVDITTNEGEGSGVIYKSDGVIVTNNHVIDGANPDQLTVTFSNGKTAKATIVGTDPLGDIAVIKAQGVSGLAAAKFGDSDNMRVGDTVLAIGSPLGLQGSVSQGIISALHRTISESSGQQGGAARSISDALQTDAAINPGNSGGALVNLAGEVIGINTAIATSGDNSGNIGVGFAISSNRAKAAADTLLKGEKVTHPYLGVKLSDGDAGGAFIADVVPGGPAATAGLQKGDIVIKIDSQTIGDSTALINAVQARKVGDKLTLTVQRNGAEQQLTVTLGDTPQ